MCLCGVSKVKKIVKHINEHNGWTVLGWHRRGQTQKGEADDEQVLSYSTIGHCSYLQPTDVTVLETVEFKNLMIPTPEHLPTAPIVNAPTDLTT